MAYGSVNADLMTTSDGVSSSGLYGFKNRIINGAMVIDQRNAGASLSVVGAKYTLDRWKADTPTGGSVQQIASTITNFINSFKYTSSASNTFFQSGQQIEYLNCYDLQNTTVSISFWAKANNSNAGSTSLVVRTRTAAGVDASVLFLTTASDTSVTITTSAALYTITKTLPSTFGALSLEFVLGSHVSSDGFEITGVQLEKGSTATSFDYRPFGTELQLCQRYFCKSFNQSVAPASNAGQAGGFVVPAPADTATDRGYLFSWRFPVSMRTSATVTTFNPSAAGSGWFTSSGSSVAASVANAGTEGVMIVNGAAASANQNAVIQLTASAEL